ncbi:FAD-dependent oxidoreductase [Microbulbifer variabilis]|uniref:FAD-dependent oxidoreductase n=1 Tax=Microbulbifer variabilis TaxID=266805 RepID=UPI001CFDB66F|nr:FAD-dependent oxidoreductase [Microbulbifer variabilis]
MSQEIPVDVLILGGGIQGITLLRELTPEYSVILVDNDLRDAESLHFHGYFSSGWNAANPYAAEAYKKAAHRWQQEMENSGVARQVSGFHAALPQEMLDIVQPNWSVAGIAFEETKLPKPFSSSRLPEHRSFRFAGDLVFEDAEVYRSVATSVRQYIFRGQVASFSNDGLCIKEATLDLGLGGRSCRIKPELVISACGAGNTTVLEQLQLSAEQVQNAQLVRPLHMLLARGPSTPAVSAFLIDLVVMFHPLEGDEGLWILTLNPEHPEFRAGPIDMHIPPEIDRDLLRTSIERLSQAMSDENFTSWAEGCQWSVYVGWKTDAPGPEGGPLMQLSYPCPYHLNDFGLQNFLAVWPNHWGLAINAAEEAGEWVRTRLSSKHPQPSKVGGVSPIGDRDLLISNKWQRQELPWRSWSEFTQWVGYHP